MSIFLTHVSTPKQKNGMCKLNNLQASCSANRHEVVDIIDGGVEVLEALCGDELYDI